NDLEQHRRKQIATNNRYFSKPDHEHQEQRRIVAAALQTIKEPRPWLKFVGDAESDVGDTTPGHTISI
ncbi:hypothetical protein A2U01_0096905, partial [Trifolium medium]|nr:hypothetical protein [Trifolium medium]